MEEVATHIMTKYSEAPQCVLCELIMTKIENDLKKHATQVEIEENIRRVCSKLPSKYSTKCKKFIEDYADFIISLVSSVPPKQLCGELNLCRADLSMDTTHRMFHLIYCYEFLVLNFFFNFVFTGDVLECGICNTAVDALSVVLQKNGPKDREILVETTCHLIPGKYNDAVSLFISFS